MKIALVPSKGIFKYTPVREIDTDSGNPIHFICTQCTGQSWAQLLLKVLKHLSVEVHSVRNVQGRAGHSYFKRR